MTIRNYKQPGNYTSLFCHLYAQKLLAIQASLSDICTYQNEGDTSHETGYPLQRGSKARKRIAEDVSVAINIIPRHLGTATMGYQIGDCLLNRNGNMTIPETVANHILPQEQGTPREIPLLATENLPLDLGRLGILTETKLAIPGVYEAVLENPETAIGMEAYIVQKNAVEISSAAKEYGKAVPDYPELLVYSEDATGNTMYIIGYELFRSLLST